ncbi:MULTISPECIES: nitroreductase family protein [unclassified Achromobacter]|uniref:nitroreductase family protein n=1 Tax=unclassified Achromobacter TaxID=2626865 RepID=UPI000B51BAE1|nr:MULTISPECIES: nitroreductase family protein [unclassified Achromobacter]OWT80109.1 nitroreductase family protein [Achromobacter sp. HZ34]OWT81992.1 nitroreductase family protein [Achromobacter sp. HZ28]
MGKHTRKAEHPISEIFLERWSPRAYTGEEISEAALLTILEAARWAPSAYNMQPWRFIYARKGTAHWDRLLATLNEFNQSWARNASALVVVVSAENGTPPGKDQPVPNASHSFDTGAAWGFLALQASLEGWQAHGMAGIDRDKARIDLGVPAGYRIEAAVAIGKPGDKSTLPEALQAREVYSPRQPLANIAAEGKFSF